MQIDIKNISGEATGRSVDLPDEVFGIEPNEHAIYLAVKQFLAHQRQGTHKTKERGEVKGSTRKIKKQKGTGTARAGDIKNPLFKGGGRVFGPRPRNYTVRLNKKVKRLARLSALSTMMRDNKIVVVEDFQIDTPKTSEYINILGALGVENGKSMLVVPEMNENIVLSSRNIKKAMVRRAHDLNTYEVLNAGTLIITEGALAAIKELTYGLTPNTANA